MPSFTSAFALRFTAIADVWRALKRLADILLVTGTVVIALIAVTAGNRTALSWTEIEISAGVFMRAFISDAVECA